MNPPKRGPASQAASGASAPASSSGGTRQRPQAESERDAKKRTRSPADEEARRILRAEMARRDFSYKQLVVALERLGHKRVTEGNLISRISRGTFTFAFAIDVLRAMGATEIDIRPVSLGRTPGIGNERDRGR